MSKYTETERKLLIEIAKDYNIFSKEESVEIKERISIRVEAMTDAAVIIYGNYSSVGDFALKIFTRIDRELTNIYNK